MTVAELIKMLNALPDDLEMKAFNHEFEAYIDPTLTVDFIIPDEDTYSGWRKITDSDELQKIRSNKSRKKLLKQVVTIS